MNLLNRDDLQLLSRHSKLSENNLDELYTKHVYPSKNNWQVFIKLLFLSLGLIFTLSGIIFFFAFNWDNLSKFSKLALVEGLLLSFSLVLWYCKTKQLIIQQILLTANSVLVGLMFAVYGQIYQTGANAFDFFLVWTLFISLWVLVSNFKPLWLIYIILVNTTFILYSQQVVNHWPSSLICSILFIMNLCFALIIQKIFQPESHPWLIKIIAFAILFFGTLGISIGIFESLNLYLALLVLLTSASYLYAYNYGKKLRDIYYPSLINLSAIVILISLFIKIFEAEDMFLPLTLIILLMTIFSVKYLVELQKKWNHGA